MQSFTKHIPSNNFHVSHLYILYLHLGEDCSIFFTSTYMEVGGWGEKFNFEKVFQMVSVCVCIHLELQLTIISEIKD